MNPIINNSRGYTILEVLIAMVILSVGVLATTKLQISFMQSNSKANIVTTGSAQAQERIAILMNKSYDDADLADSDVSGDAGFGTAGLNDVGAAADQSDTTDPRYTYYWNIADNTPADDMKTVNVIVLWLDERNVQRQVNYTFLKANL